MADLLLGGVTLANPDAEGGWIETALDNSHVRRMANNTLKITTSGNRKIRFEMQWSFISVALASTIETQASVTTAQTLTLPTDSSTVSVLVVPNSWNRNTRGGANEVQNYDCSLAVEQV